MTKQSTFRSEAFNVERGSVGVEYTVILALLVLIANISVVTFSLTLDPTFTVVGKAIGGSTEGIQPPGS